MELYVLLNYRNHQGLMLYEILQQFCFNGQHQKVYQNIIYYFVVRSSSDYIYIFMIENFHFKVMIEIERVRIISL